MLCTDSSLLVDHSVHSKFTQNDKSMVSKGSGREYGLFLNELIDHVEKEAYIVYKNEWKEVMSSRSRKNSVMLDR